MKDNIIDLFSGKPLLSLDKRIVPDVNSIEEKGTYVGVVTKELTHYLREVSSLLEAKARQIEQLTIEYNNLQGEYETYLNRAVIMLGIEKNFSDGKGKELFISIDGHVWIMEEKNTMR